ncbi:glycosyltransferase [Pseudoalteromonas sp. CR1]|uniref:glycosyltransferase n=1 Tax=Pseudoalteromonas sp. CR1 TaxID=2861964 RepID=UPI001C5F43AE|nr:glycosyltransferase [Pseudoalteromonas sp. CR1]MBW4966823.1 glycosyltransferase [Pseudoalteromonas sp. CR1]
MKKEIIIVMHDFRGGGAERVAVTLANSLSDLGNNVTLVFLEAKGPFLSEISSEISLRELKSKRIATSIIELSKIFKVAKPDLIISHMTHVNVATAMATLISNTRDKLTIVEHSQMQSNYLNKKSLYQKLIYLSTKVLYRIPNQRVGVSGGVCRAMSDFTGLDIRLFTSIYNPVITEKLLTVKYNKELRHEICKSDYLFVFVGRLIKSKRVGDFINAINLASSEISCEAIILGDGPEKYELEELAKSLGMDKKIHFLGFKENPHDYIKIADALVLTSEWEGLPTVLIEALALGTQVISSDCKSGPSEILSGGVYGSLYPVGDVNTLSELIVNSISLKPISCEQHLNQFTTVTAAYKYLGVK